MLNRSYIASCILFICLMIHPDPAMSAVLTTGGFIALMVACFGTGVLGAGIVGGVSTYHFIEFFN